MRCGAVVGLMFALVLGAAPSAVAQPFGLAPGASPYGGPQHHMTLRRAGNELRLLDGGRTVLRRQASAAGRLVVSGTAGNDTLHVDYAGGDPAPHGLVFDGGADAGGTGDALELTGGRFDRAVVTFTPDRLGHGHDGRIRLDGKTIEFRELEPLLINAGNLADVVFNIPQGDGDNQTVLEDDAGSSPTMSQLRSGAATFETTTFTHPTNSLTINLGNDATESLAITDDSVAKPIAVNGGSGANILTLADGKTLAGGQFDGAGGTDAISYAAYSTAVSVNLGATAGLAASLTADQEQPATSSTASGLATLTYDNVAKTFDVSVTVSGLPAASVTGFHIHGAPVGVNGSVRVDFGAGSVVSDGSGGFTFSANDVPLPPDLEAALLGGATYLNVHTAANPTGAIRGQLMPGSFVATLGTANGSGSLQNVENLTGGSAADSLVGTSAVNAIAGGAGNDTIVPAGGNDTASGGANDDLLIWSNGDATDVLDGDGGNRPRPGQRRGWRHRGRVRARRQRHAAELRPHDPGAVLAGHRHRRDAVGGRPGGQRQPHDQQPRRRRGSDEGRAARIQRGRPAHGRDAARRHLGATARPGGQRLPHGAGRGVAAHGPECRIAERRDELRHDREPHDGRRRRQLRARPRRRVERDARCGHGH